MSQVKQLSEKKVINKSFKQQLAEAIRKAAYSRDVATIFKDFLTFAAISISNAVDLNHREEREKRYLDLVKQYKKEEMDQFVRMFALLTMALEEETTDVLGEVFHILELHNKYIGQYFSAQPIGNFLSACCMPAGDDMKALVGKKGYVTLGECACGSGVMVIGAFNTMRSAGLNPQKQLLVTATDIDEKAVMMAYLQLSLLGIPAVVIHGNSLSMEVWAHWYTPMYIIDGWPLRLRYEESVDKMMSLLKSLPESDKSSSEVDETDSIPAVAATLSEGKTDTIDSLPVETVQDSSRSIEDSPVFIPTTGEVPRIVSIDSAKKSKIAKKKTVNGYEQLSFFDLIVER